MPKAAALLALDAVYRAESRRIFARLVKALGDFDVAEDALQEAVRAASVQWPDQGLPDNPPAWIYHAARNRGISLLRQRRRSLPLSDQDLDTPSRPEQGSGDDLLRLLFLCCHPALSPDAQVALTLREVCELTTEEIASAYLVRPPTIAQRIVRAKAKIREAAIPLELPPKEEMPSRLPVVLKTIYLVFNEAYSASSGGSLLRQDLMSLSVHLGRQLFSLAPEPEVGGLLALILASKARSPSRSTPEGDLILLQNQDRSLWDRSLLAEASSLAADSFRSGRFGPYTIQAGIALVHAESPSWSETDWSEIIGLYQLLGQIEPSPVASLNHAVATAMRDGPEAGITQITDLITSGGLADYHRAYAARGELHLQRGRLEQAKADLEQALSLARQEPEKRHLQRRLEEIGENVGRDVESDLSHATSQQGSSS